MDEGREPQAERRGLRDEAEEVGPREGQNLRWRRRRRFGTTPRAKRIGHLDDRRDLQHLSKGHIKYLTIVQTNIKLNILSQEHEDMTKTFFKYQPQDHRYVLFERGRLRLFGIDMMELSDLPSSLQSAAEPVDKTATYKSD